MIKQIDHLNIVVSDLQKSVTFYTELLGFRVTRQAVLQGEWIDKVVNLKNVTADVVFLEPPNANVRIELLCYKSPEGQSIPANSLANTTGIRHVAFQVDDIKKATAKLEKANVRFLSDPVKVPSSTVKHQKGEKSLVYFYDPDGVILELAEYS